MLSPLLLFLTMPQAHAGASSADIELFQPRFGDGPVAGVDAPWTRKGTLRVGLFGLYEANPLVEYRDDGTEVPVIATRIAGVLGGSYDLSDRFGFRLTVPLSFDAGGLSDSAADGFGLEDPTVGARLTAVRTKPFQLGVHADLPVPFGSKTSWRGESQPRLNAGVLLATKLSNFYASADVGVNLRNAIETDADFTLASELAVDAGLGYELVPKKFALGAGVWTRAGFHNFFGGGGENSVEALASAKITPIKELQIELDGGRGLTEGYGTSDLRVMLGLTYKKRFQEEAKPVVEEPKPDPTTELKEVSDEDLDRAIEAEKRAKEAEEARKKAEEELALAGRAWKDNELARVNGSRIEIRDPLKFGANSNNVLPESVPTLQYVGRLIGPDDLLVIEGHASEEGEYKYNYELSLSRARAVWEEMVKAGISPAHLSYRGMGEVVPAKAGEDEAALAENRRVVFYLVRLSAPPTGVENRKAPWDGTDLPAAPVPLPAATTPTPAPAPTPAPTPAPEEE